MILDILILDILDLTHYETNWSKIINCYFVSDIWLPTSNCHQMWEELWWICEKVKTFSTLSEDQSRRLYMTEPKFEFSTTLLYNTVVTFLLLFLLLILEMISLLWILLIIFLIPFFFIAYISNITMFSYDNKFLILIMCYQWG